MAYLLKALRGSRLAAFHTRGYIATSPLVYSPEILEAKKDNRPIVALESTIITHGMPYPKNLETAVQVEDIIKQQGAIPATIAILQGQLTIGLTEEQLQYLATAKGVVKASRRDLAPITANKLDGATTVAGTIIASEMADIPVFVTGGIGGVHREGQDTLDISADLNELGRSKTLVVCSGVKSILDIGRTLEYLETQGVCVCSFGDTKDFPAFYTRKSGHHAPYNVASAQEAAKVLQVAYNLGLNSGTLVAVPVPEEHAMDEIVIENAIREALRDADTKNIRGKEVTPFILAAVANATGGTSLDTNIALIKNNAKVGAQIAIEFQKLRNADNFANASNIGFSKTGKWANSVRGLHTSCRTHAEEKSILASNCDGDVLVIGGANLDRTYRVTEKQVKLDGSTHGCNTEQCGGGVARNMAEALWRLRGGRVKLLTAVGDDADGQYLSNIAPGLLLDGCVIKGARTPTYAAVLDAQGECLLGLGNMTLHDQITIDLVNKHIDVLEKSPLVVMDGNAPQSTIEHVLRLCNEMQKPVFFEPTDRRKAVKPLQNKHKLKYASPNLNELRAMANKLQPDLSLEETSDVHNILKLSEIVSPYIETLIVTVGAEGVILIHNEVNSLEGIFVHEARMYPVKALDTVENVSGAGDCFASGFIFGLLSGYKEPCCVSVGFQAARSALLSKNTVPTSFNINNIENAEYHILDRVTKKKHNL